ncbi:MAG: chaperone protein DnaJ [Candidatus Methanofastidiosum methylothiophilum]|uniref:Chaperone protein DnaJ n=1 Tax=Candidatus Methanofastidiosum methylothiophilum TaxID=1705564 RepID=A0A150J5V0_9EURY|nr:MAG: chaperone protein DnaJ [Candidatus Methanofastidiosum methylthiophilus]NMC77321.1 J domain-containing protein [Candidatus Methanofastidiosa archaeon]
MSYNPKKDYYELIGGITPSSSQKDIKKAYRKKVLEYHPDKNPGKEEWAKKKFLELKDTYEILIDTEKKAKYDKERENYLSSKETLSYEGRPGWKYTSSQDVPSSTIFDSNPRTFVRSRPYTAYNHTISSKQTTIRILVYAALFTMFVLTVYMLSQLRQ